MGAFRLPMPGADSGRTMEGWGGGAPASGGNQYFATLPTLSRPAAPTTTANTGINNQPFAANRPGLAGNTPGATGGTADVGGGLTAGLPIDPNFTGAFLNWLGGQMGKGAQHFDWTTALPGGGHTAPGQLTAQLDPFMRFVMQQMQGGLPGSGTLGEIAKTGDPSQIPGMLTDSTTPVDQLPGWQAMVEAQQRGISENAANLKEQFNFAGDLSSSPMGNAMGDFFSQTSKDQNAALLQAQQQALEASQGRKLQVGQDILGASESAAGRRLGAAGEQGQLGLGQEQLQGQLGQFLQGLDQQSIQNMYQEFLRTRPGNNPLLNDIYGMAQFTPQYTQKPKGGGVLGGILGGVGDLIGGITGMGGLGSLGGLFGGGGTPGPGSVGVGV